jgi:alpha-tubulin suppressor-like RCC1 family protein
MNAGVRSDGQVFEWQQNFGLVQRTDVGSVRRLARGAGHVLALRTDGTIMAWGANSAGQLGNGTTTSTTIATPVTGFTHVAEVAAGNSHSVAAKIDGTLWVWGYNDQGQLGAAPHDAFVVTLLPSPAGVTRCQCKPRLSHAGAKSDGTVGPGARTPKARSAMAPPPIQLTPLAVAG